MAGERRPSNGRPAPTSCCTSRGLSRRAVGRMIYTVACRNLTQIKRVDPFQTTYVETVLLGIGAPLMMCINAADRAKEMFGYPCIELIKFQYIGPTNNPNARQRNRSHNRAFSTADGTIAPAGVNNTVGKSQFEFHCSAMACRLMLGPDLRCAYLFNHDIRSLS